MKAYEQEVLAQTRYLVWNRAGGHCEVCGELLHWNSFQMAHRIPQRKWLVKKYGKAVIHHPDNLAATCSLRCNNAVSIAGSPVEVEALAESIEEKLNGQAE